MSGSNKRNVAPSHTKRPGSARRATEKDPLKRNDQPATSSSEDDFSAIINAIETIQKVDLHVFRRQINSIVSHDLKYGQNGQDASARWAENVDWETKYKDLKEKYDKIAKQIEEKSELEDKLKNLTAQLKTTEQTYLEQKKELVLLQQRVESGDKSLKALNQKLKECMNDLESKEKLLQTQQKAMDEVQKAKDDALTRLSKQMGQQMSEGNPNITDLSDQNRPSKLGEIYSELYDNEWTNAFEVLTETFHLDEKSVIELLLQILWESSKHASDVSQSAMKTIEKLLSGSSEGATPDCKRLLREARKHVDIKKADGLFQDFVREKLTSFVERRYLREENVSIYIKKCFQLCWLMSIQDPPVVLSKDPQRGANFDTNLYKQYTHSGDIIDYVVWPALLLHKDGPLLVKGVAETYLKPRAKTAPAIVRSATKHDKSFDRNQAQYEKNKRESDSDSDLTVTTQQGYKARSDATFSSKSSHVHIVTQTYPVQGGKHRVYTPAPTAPAQRPLSGQMHLYQVDVFRSRYDKERFQRFSHDCIEYEEPFLRSLYGTDYDRYSTLFVHQKFGNYKFT